jgi:glycerophosphoryl diester phosphodiesterase
VSAPRRLLYAHRGASYECPENTLAAFSRALELGVDALETDAHMTADGHVVVAHDPSGARMCGVNRAIRDTALHELKTWNAGLGFIDADGQRPFAEQRLTIPTLEELVVEFPGVPLNIDLKQRTPPIVDATLAALRRLGAEHRTTLASFDTATLRAVRARGYQGPTALARREVIALVGVPRLARRVLAPPGSAAQLPVSFGPLRLASRRIVDKCHALGLRVDFWTVNRPAEARQLLALGADGIMTDDPRAVAPVFASLDAKARQAGGGAGGQGLD